MKLFSWGKDGGAESTVGGFWLIELKRLFSIVFLCFENGTRDAYHDHAFNCLSWVIKGKLVERHLDGRVEEHRPSVFPVRTHTDTFHQVESVGRTWVISFRGPWTDRWHEYLPATGQAVTLTNGRKEVQ